MDAKVFVSYVSADYSIAQEVKKELEKNGLSVFDVQTLAAGRSWVSEVNEAMRSVDVLIALVSNSYSSSANTATEWMAALAQGKRVVPVTVESDARVPALLAPYLGIDISDPRVRTAKLELLAKQIMAMSDSPASRTDEIGSMEMQLAEARNQWASMNELVSLTAERRKVLLRHGTLLLMSILGLALTVVFLVDLVATMSASGTPVVLRVTVPAISCIVGVLFGWFGSTRKRVKRFRRPVANPSSETRSENEVRP